MITGTVVLDVSRDSESNDRRIAGRLYGIPAGVRVIVQVGSRDFAPPWMVDQLCQYDDRLHYDVHGETEAVLSWVKALRGEPHIRLGWPA